MKRPTILIYVAVALLVLLLMVQVDAKKQKGKKQKDNRHVEKMNGGTGNEKKRRNGHVRKHNGHGTAEVANDSLVPTPTEELDQPPTEEHGHKQNGNRKKNRQHAAAAETGGTHHRKKGQRKQGRPNHKRQERKEEKQNRRNEMNNLELCEDQTTCDAGMCCVMTNGTASCQDLTLPHGRKCHHDCQCASGLHCMKKNAKHHIKRAGRCMPAENTDAVADETTEMPPQQNTKQTT